MSYYVTNENSVLNINNAHLKVSGNIQTDVMKLGAIEFAPPASDVPGTVNFTNVTTGVTTTSNLNVGGTLMLGSVELVTATAALEQTVNLGNVTSNTVQFTNATTGIVATGNVEASKFIGDGSLLTGITTIESNVDLIRNTNNTAFINLNSNVVTEFPRSKKLIKYPRVALTSASRNAYENGYKVTFSSEYDSSTWAAEHVFDNSLEDGGGAWASGGSRYGNGGQSYSAGASIGGFDGEYVHLELPVSINLSLVRMLPRTYQLPCPQAPKDYIIIASTDGVTYDLLRRITNDPDTGTFNEILINTPKLYNRFAVVIEKTISSDIVGITEIEFLGTPEYDPEAHGTDVTVKSYPNVPNTDWLELRYDAENYSGAGDVQDETGNNSGGILDGVTYDSVSKSFTFDGGVKIYRGPMTAFTSGTSYTASIWFKIPEIVTNQYLLFHFGHGTSGESFGLNIQRGNVGAFLWGGSTTYTTDNLYSANEWVNAACTINGSIVNVYLNGTLQLSYTQDIVITIPTNPCLSLGIHFNGEQSSFFTGGFFIGSILVFIITYKIQLSLYSNKLQSISSF